MQEQDFSERPVKDASVKYRDYFRFDFNTLSPDMRPRERLMRLGPQMLSDQELLALILNCGIKGKNVGVVAGELLELLEHSSKVPDLRELTRIGGLGRFKAGTVAAALELGRRYWDFSGTRVQYPGDVFDLVRHYADRKQERFLSVSLNGAHKVIAIRVVTVGLVNRTIVHPREVFADPLTDHCSAICVCHNHPSGELEPSREDDDVTTSLEDAADLLGIRFLDHIIFSDTMFYSYRKEERLKNSDKARWAYACSGPTEYLQEAGPLFPEAGNSSGPPTDNAQN